MRGEWIEIPPYPVHNVFGRSLPMRGEWIEIIIAICQNWQAESLPMRGEWIEIKSAAALTFIGHVSPHAGRVD